MLSPAAWPEFEAHVVLVRTIFMLN